VLLLMRNAEIPLSGHQATRFSSEAERFDILLYVRLFREQYGFAVSALLALALDLGILSPGLAAKTQAPNNPLATQQSLPVNPAQSPAASLPAPTSLRVAPSVGLNIVVLDPAHGGTDLGARGTEGVRESEVVLQFAAQLRQALEQQGFQVIQTRDGNENPSFDDRSARANAQRGAVFITLHIASTGLAGSARTYVMPDTSPLNEATGLIPWDRAQGPFVGLSRKLGDMVQAELAKRFKGSPATAQVAPIRQLRTTAAPAIAVEISSVSVENRAILDRMIPGVAEAIAHGVAAFRPSYVVPVVPGNLPSPGVQQ
jgi:N-acetylmuramoyl-L-alanine amidase